MKIKIQYQKGEKTSALAIARIIGRAMWEYEAVITSDYGLNEKGKDYELVQDKKMEIVTENEKE